MVIAQEQTQVSLASERQLAKLAASSARRTFAGGAVALLHPTRLSPLPCDVDFGGLAAIGGLPALRGASQVNGKSAMPYDAAPRT